VCFLVIFQGFALQGKLGVIPLNAWYLLWLALRAIRCAHITTSFGSLALSPRHLNLCVLCSALGMGRMATASFCAFVQELEASPRDTSQVVPIWSTLSCVATMLLLPGATFEPMAPGAELDHDGSVQAALKKLTLRSTDFPVDTEGTCLICLANFSESDEPQLQLRCTHLYHEQCMKLWLSKGGQGCPLRCTTGDDVVSA
jgi:hypothetical protein